MATAIGSYVTTALLKARANIGDTVDDTVLGLVCDQVNMYIEQRTRRILAPITSATYLYDGDGSDRLYLPQHTTGHIGGIRAISLLELADQTGGSYTTITSGDYFLRGQVLPAAPYDWLYMSDNPTGAYAYFPPGRATARVTGTAGWAAIPDDIAEVAVVAAVRAWHSSEAGQQDVIGSDDMGRPVVSRFFSVRDQNTLTRYALSSAIA